MQTSNSDFSCSFSSRFGINEHHHQQHWSTAGWGLYFSSSPPAFWSWCLLVWEHLLWDGNGQFWAMLKKNTIWLKVSSLSQVCLHSQHTPDPLHCMVDGSCGPFVNHPLLPLLMIAPGLKLCKARKWAKPKSNLNLHEGSNQSRLQTRTFACVELFTSVFFCFTSGLLYFRPRWF